MAKRGQPTKYKKEYNEQVIKLCRLGATDKEIAYFFNVTDTTINNWKLSEPIFFESIKKGKIESDANIANSLYNRAKGYEHVEDKIFNNNGEPMIVKSIKHYPPDTAAAFIWLKNRRGKQWVDKQEIEQTNIDLKLDKAARKARIAELEQKRKA